MLDKVNNMYISISLVLFAFFSVVTKIAYVIHIILLDSAA